MTAAPRGDAFIGLMSGTSLDGISACVVRFSALGTRHSAQLPQAESREPRAELISFVTKPFSAEQRSRLLRATLGATAEEYSRLSFDLGAWLADAAVAALAESGVPRGDVRAIGSHGQTLWHDPPHSTWQLGESAVIAERLGIDVVSDFRVRDVAAGGQGAPLVPIADALLFSASHWRALQNIGGIGNVTVVPPGGDAASVRAFDTGPGVAVIDAVVRLLKPDATFDRDGAMARRGRVLEGVVAELLTHPYFAAQPPKSTGREIFSAEYVRSFVRMCRASDSSCRDEDIVATATALTARSIADAYRRFMPEPVEEVLLSGGGANNGALVEMLAAAIAPVKVRRFGDLYFDGEAKEAVAFALLAKLFIDGRPANVPSATGARGQRILGKLTPGRTP
jgi:anhydro-N-acetylmuramic acid kinase